ncbi:MAG: hypothetical protein U9N60_04730 [Thermodesulfobacteriota bacterium]|nr:hypothetical protein [Thermodesulfobacteriota bacterium]
MIEVGSVLRGLKVKSAVDFQGMPDHTKKLVCSFYKVPSSAFIVSRKGEINKTTGEKTEQKSTADLTTQNNFSN